MTTIDDYLAWAAANGARPATLYTTRCVLHRIEAVTGPLELCDADGAERWWITRTGLAEHTRRSELSRFRAWVQWAIEHDLIERSPLYRIRPPRLPRPAPRPISEDDLAHALIVSSGRCRSWILLGAYAGLRACECARLRPDELTATELFVRDGKGGHAARLPAHQYLEQVTVDWPDDLEPYVVSHTVNRFLHSMRIPATMHKLRARFATRLYEQTHDLRLVQEMMRHANPSTTAIYVGWNPDRARSAVAAL